MQHLLTIRNNLGDIVTSPLGSITRIERNNRSIRIQDGSVDVAVLVFDRESMATSAESDALATWNEYLSYDHDAVAGV